MVQIIISESFFVPFEALFFAMDKACRPFRKYDINNQSFEGFGSPRNQNFRY